MLINTILLFLHNALPVFILASLLLSYFSLNNVNKTNLTLLLSGLMLTVSALFILSHYLEYLSQIIDGKGTELFLSFGYTLVYFSIFGLFILNNTHRYITIKKGLAFITFFIISCVNGANFVIYLMHYWMQAQQIETIFIGTILGGGICLSISILFYFLLRYVNKKIYVNATNYSLLFFALGQLMQATLLLQQVDILSSSQPLWDSGNLIAERSGIGQLLTVLFGYETTPTLVQLSIYGVALFIPVLLIKSSYISFLRYGKKS